MSYVHAIIIIKWYRVDKYTDAYTYILYELSYIYSLFKGRCYYL